MSMIDAPSSPLTALKAAISEFFFTPRDRILAPVLPARSRAGRALVLVIAIMTFLAALTGGAVHLIADASRDWSRAIAREVTVQVRPTPGRMIEADVAGVADLARAVRGVEEVKVYSRAEAEKLLEPWLGAGLDLSELPVPRLIVMRLARGANPDFTTLKALMKERVPNAGLDDHRLWLSRLALMADSLVAIGLAILALVMTATAFAVVFATRGAMSGTAQVIDVLHLVGAQDHYIAGQFQRHFLRLGLKGGMMGAIGAMIFFGGLGMTLGNAHENAATEQIEALFGRFSLPLSGYLTLLLIGVIVAFVTGIVSRITVYRTLGGRE